mmetsp:Transcript_3815/g.13733  ORF Transcript_3815/g.13733 Transcript_3815/m.13733 type:complete len:604 (+) Transcript_3815:216-2027(+)
MNLFTDGRLASELEEQSALDVDYAKLARNATTRAGLRTSTSVDDLSAGSTQVCVQTPRASEGARTLKMTTTAHLTTVRSFGSESSLDGGEAFENHDIVANASKVETDVFATMRATISLPQKESTATAATAAAPIATTTTGMMSVTTSNKGKLFDVANDPQIESLRRSPRTSILGQRVSIKEPFVKASSRIRGAKLKNVTALYSEIRIASLGVLTHEDIQLCVRSMETKKMDPSIPTVFIPREYEVKGLLFEEPFSASVDEHGVHKVTWGFEGDGRLIAQSDPGTMNAEDACVCIVQEITRRQFERIPSLTAPARTKRLCSATCSNPNCGVASTPLMRRGPNGMRTLCNACGLWFARRGTMRPCGKVNGASEDIVVEVTPPPPTDASPEEKEIFIRTPPTKDDFNAIMAFGYHTSQVQGAIRAACKAIHSAEKLRRTKAKMAYKKHIETLFARKDELGLFDSCGDLETFVAGSELDVSNASKKRKTKSAKSAKVDTNKRQNEASKGAFVAHTELAELFMNMEDLPWFTMDVTEEFAADSVSRQSDKVEIEQAKDLESKLPRPESQLTLTCAYALDEDDVGNKAMEEILHMPSGPEEIITAMQGW